MWRKEQREMIFGIGQNYKRPIRGGMRKSTLSSQQISSELIIHCCWVIKRKANLIYFLLFDDFFVIVVIALGMRRTLENTPRIWIMAMTSIYAPRRGQRMWRTEMCQSMKSCRELLKIRISHRSFGLLPLIRRSI